MVFGRLLRRDRPRVIPREAHGIRLDAVSENARRAIAKLQERGYEAFVVGGAVRDLALSGRPKDFDIATSATPPQVRRLFANSRFIGRRFRLVHLYFGRMPRREIIEASTFRADAPTETCEDSGRILSDNTFGDAAADARRRDFTVNALLYNPQDETIIDYIGGFADLRARRLAIIGDPSKRFREDPLRILRAVRLAAKLDLKIEAATRRAMSKHAELIKTVPRSRLFDEFVKVFKSGAFTPLIDSLAKLGVDDFLPPAAIAGRRDDFSRLAFTETDRRARTGRNVSLSFVVAALFWPDCRDRWLAARADGIGHLQAMEDAIEKSGLIRHWFFTRRVAALASDILFLQARMMSRHSSRRAASLLTHQRFEHALAFLNLRAQTDEAETEKLFQWWEDFQSGDSETRATLAAAARGDNKTPARRRRRKKT